jgi:hypothetical protein
VYRVLDGHGGIDAMLVVEVDVIQTEAVQAGLAAGTHVLRPAADAPRATGIMLPPHPKLCGHLHLLSRQQLQRLHANTQQLPHVKMSPMPDGMLSSQQARNQEKKRDLAEEYLVSFF